MPGPLPGTPPIVLHARAIVRRDTGVRLRNASFAFLGVVLTAGLGSVTMASAPVEAFVLFMVVVGWLPVVVGAAISPVSTCERADAMAVLEAWKTRRTAWDSTVTEASHEAAADVRAWSAAKASFATHGR